jgi:hypothetical protein
MLRLTENDTKVHRVAAQSIDRVSNDNANGILPDGLSEFGQAGAFPEFGARVHVAVDLSLLHTVVMLRGILPAVLLLGHQGGTVLFLSRGADTAIDGCFIEVVLPLR